MSIVNNSNHFNYLRPKELEVQSVTVQENSMIGVFSEKYTGKAQLQQDIKDGVEIYKILSSGCVKLLGAEELLRSREIYLRANRSENLGSLPCTHSMLEKHWVAEDYEFVFANGYCVFSCEEDVVVLLQRGVLRFGGRAGISVDMLLGALQSQTNIFTPIEIEIVCKLDNPYEKEVFHKVPYGLNMLSDLCKNRSENTICPTEISDIPSEEFSRIEASLQKLAPLLKIANLQSTRPYICKECKGWKKNKNVERFAVINPARENGSPIFCCPGCSKMIALAEGCSMITCTKKSKEEGGCLSGTRTCVYCLNGSTGLIHDADCTEKTRQCIANNKPFPLLKECIC